MSNYLRELGYHKEAIKQMNRLLSNDPGRHYLFHKANSLKVLGKERRSREVVKRG